MRIVSIHVQGFRSLLDATVEFDDQTAIVGRNSAGKSSVLNALSLFFDLSAHVTEYDYFDKDPNGEIRVQITFDNLRPAEQETFGTYVRDGLLTVTKVITKGGVRYVGSRKQIPEFSKIRGAKVREQQSAINKLRETATFSDLSGPINSQAAIDSLLDNYELSHPDRCSWVESEGQFLGPKNVGGGSLDNFTQFVLIPAVRDAHTELARQGAIHKLLDVLILRQLAEREDVKALNKHFESEAARIYSVENIPELKELSTNISECLNRYAPGVRIEINFDELKAPKLPTPQAVALISEEQFRCPISHVGHGVQRAVILAVLEQLAALEAKNDIENEPSSAPDLILAIEEPELYLHPSRCRYLGKTLAELSANSAEPRTQVVYTTHSPIFVSIERFSEVRIASKSSAPETTTKQTVLNRSQIEDVVKLIADAQDGDDGASFDASGFCARSETTMTVPVNEGFFAELVVLVEGHSDAAALEAAAHLSGSRWDERGVAVIPVHGKGNIDKAYAVFRSLDIPTYFCFDADGHETGNSQRENNAKKNRCLLRIAGHEPTDFPKTRTTSDFAVFGEELERELRSADSEYFGSTRDSIADTLHVGKPSRVLKKPAGMRAYVDAAYSDGKLPPVISEIVQIVTELRAAVS